MELFKSLAFISLLVFVQPASSQDSLDDMIGALENREVATDSDSDSSLSSASISESPSSSSSASVGCGSIKENQKSIPLGKFLTLLLSDKRKINVNHDSYSKTLDLDGGLMIANCNSMLKYNFSKAKNGRPHVFEVEIKTPSDCKNDGTCKYSYMNADPNASGVSDGNPKEDYFEPSLAGFYSCLKKAGVIANEDGKLKFKRENVVQAPFKYTENGMNSTDEVVFYSRGPLSINNPAKYQKVEIDGKNSCEMFETIKDGGYQYQTLADKNYAEKQEMLNELKNCDNYKSIDKHLPRFSEFAMMYNVLEGIRNELLSDRVKELHTEIAGKDDLSELNPTVYKTIIADFLKKIINPLKEEISDVKEALEGRLTIEERKALQKRINHLTAKLIKYNKDPYLTIADYESMISFVKKAPLHEEEWREAALDLFNSNNSAFHYSKFNSDIREKNKDKTDFKKTPKLKLANAYIKRDTGNQRNDLKKLGVLASNPDKSFSREYAGKMNTLRQKQEYQFKKTNYDNFYIQQSMLPECVYKPRMWNQFTQRRCLNNKQSQIDFNNTLYQEMAQLNSSSFNYYNKEAQRWAQIEATRNGQQPVDYRNPASFQFTPPSIPQSDFRRGVNFDPRMNSTDPRMTTFFEPRMNHFDSRMPSFNQDPFSMNYNRSNQFNIYNSPNDPFTSYMNPNSQFVNPNMNYQSTVPSQFSFTPQF